MNKLTKKLAIGAFALSLGISSTYAISKSKQHTDTIDTIYNTHQANGLQRGLSVFEHIFGWGGLILGLTSVGLSIAQLCKKGPNDQLKKLVNVLNSINQKVDSINNKIDELFKKLTDEFIEVQMQFNGMKIREDLESINKFDSMAFDNYLNQLKTCINRDFLEFADTSTYQYKNTYSVDKGYFLELTGKTGINVDITGDQVKNAVIAANAEKTITINNIEEWTILVGEKLCPAVKSQLDDVLITRQNEGFSDDTFIEAFASGFQDYLIDQFAIAVFKSGNTYQTYAASVINTFNKYCSDLGGLTSPLLLQYDIYENLFCFQKDANYINEITNEKRNLFVDTGYEYLNNFLQFASFTEQVAYLSGVVDEDTISNLETTILNTFSSVVSMIQQHYRVDKEGKPVDNYCYNTRCPVEVVKNHIYTEDPTTHTEDPTTAKIQNTSSKIDLQDDEDGVSFAELAVDETRPEYRLSADELTYMSIMERSMPILPGNSRLPFKDYLNDVLNADITTNLVVKFDQAKAIVDANGYVFNAYSFGDPTNPDMHGGMFYDNRPDDKGLDIRQIVIGDSGYNGKDKIDTQYLLHTNEIRGDYFDFNAGGVLYDESLYSYGFYYDEHKNWDDIGYFSSSTIAGMENDIVSFNETSCRKLNTNTCVFQDQASTIKITEKDGEVYTHSVYTDFDLYSLNKVEMEYGKYKLNDSPFINALNSNDKEYIDNLLMNLGYDEMVPYKDPSNDGLYWVTFDKFPTTQNNHNSNDVTDYEKYKEFISSEQNLSTLDKEIKNWEGVFNDSFDDLNNNQKYFNTGLSGDELTTTVNKIVSFMDALKDAGVDVGGYVKPSSSATEFEVDVEIKPQLGEILSLDNDGKVVPSFVKNYVVAPVLSYKEGGESIHCSLPSSIASLIRLANNINVNIPVDAGADDLSVKQAVSINFNQKAATYGFESSSIGATILNDESAPYIAQSISALGVYSITGLTEGLNVKYIVKPGQEPKCNAGGYKTAYYDENNNKYYSAPNDSSMIGDGSETAYNNWISELGEGYIEPTGVHNYQYVDHTFDPNTKKFTVNFKCSDCQSTANTTVDGTFVTDTPATCKEAAKGHYIASGAYEGTLYFVSDDGEYSYGAPLPHEDLIHHEYVSPSCTMPGSEEYYECPDCGTKFKDPEGTTLFEDDPIIPATEHEHLQYVEKKLPTTTESGYVEHWYCPDCDSYFLDEECTQRTTRVRITIPKTGYTFDLIPRLDPTHFKAGHRAYYQDKLSGEYFVDINGYEKIDDIDEWLSETGEGYLAKEACSFDGPVSYVVNGDYCTASHQCTHPGCTELESETTEAIYITDTPATCTSNALGHIEAVFENPEFGSYVTPLNSYEFTNSATGHHFDNPQISWSGKVCTVSGSCEDCEKELSFSKEGTIVIDTPATCHSNAIGHYEAVFNIGNIGTQSSESFEIPNTKTEHEYGDFQVIWDGNVCKLTGKCIHDGCEETFTSYKEGTVVIDTPATCTEDAKGHYVAVFDIEGVGIQKTPENSIVISNSALGHHYENGECTRCHEKDPNGNYINELSNKNSALTAVVIVFSCLSGLGIITSAVFGIRLFKSKKKKTVSK